MPLALEVGMTPEQFFYDDIDYLDAYIKAYYHRISFGTWINGAYVQQALRASMLEVMPSAINKGLGAKGKLPEVEYFNKPIDLLEETQKKKAEEITKKLTAEEQYRLQVARCY